jgi:predicted kinase
MAHGHRVVMATSELVYERGAVLLVAGLPGSGKTTLLRRAVTGPGVVVLDSDDVRRTLRRLGARGPLVTALRPVVHLTHLVRVVLAVRGRDCAVVVHESGTRPRVRRALARLACGAGRTCHAVFLDVEPAQAERDQRHRDRRPVSERGMARHARSWRLLRRRLRVGEALRGDGFASAVALDRAAAAAIERIRFA